MSMLAEGQRIGAYRIVRLLGQGGMGAVYEARQEPLDRRVALKTLHADYARSEDAVQRFFNEAKVLSRLEHPSIVQVSDFGRSEDGVAFLVMEFLRGHSLARRIDERTSRGDRINPVTVCQLGWQIADVLAVAHAQGIIHRDIKPDNIMLVADPVAPGGERVKILDFGIAKLMRPEDRGSVKTDTQAVMGTPSYMSPEQCAGAGGVDTKTDVYSLGCLLYETLAGRPPFVADGPGRIIGMHLYQQPPPLGSLVSKLPSGVADLVHRMLTKEKAQRPGMDEVADELGRLLAKLSGAGPVVRSRISSRTDPDATRAVAVPNAVSTLGQSIGQSGARRLRQRAVLMAGALLVGLPVTYFALRNPSSPSTTKTSQPAKVPTEKPAASGPVTWQLRSDPSGAQVFDEQGALLGTTPLSLTQTPSVGQATLRLHRDGYSDEQISISRSQNQTQTVTLTRKASLHRKDSPSINRPVPTTGKPAAPNKTAPAVGKPGVTEPIEKKPSNPSPARIGYED